MHLANPYALAALPFLAAVVIAAHFRLFSLVRRYYRYEYSMAFLLKRPERERRLLRLVAKLAVVCLLVAAAAAPSVTVQRIITVSGEAEVKVSTGNIRPAVVLVIDVSGSMAGAKLAEAKRVSSDFVARLLPKDFDIGLIAFNGKVVKAIPPTGNRGEILEAISSLEANDGTVYTNPLSTALSWLRAYSIVGVPSAVVFVTDGLPADRWYRCLLEDYRKLRIPIYTVFIGGSPAGIAETRYIAHTTGGEQFTAQTAVQLHGVFKRIAEKVTKRMSTSIAVSAVKKVPEEVPLTPYLVAAALALTAALYLDGLRRYRVFCG